MIHHLYIPWEHKQDFTVVVSKLHTKPRITYVRKQENVRKFYCRVKTNLSVVYKSFLQIPFTCIHLKNQTRLLGKLVSHTRGVFKPLLSKPEVYFLNNPKISAFFTAARVRRHIFRINREVWGETSRNTRSLFHYDIFHEIQSRCSIKLNCWFYF